MREKLFCHFCGSRLLKKYIEGRWRLFCESCKDAIYENPIPAACVIAIDGDDNLLLVKRNIEPQWGLWCLPGGFMEVGETSEEAALRELKEETGLDGKIDCLLSVASHPSSIHGTVLLVNYLVKEFSDALVPGGDAAEALFFPYFDLPQIAFETHKRFIRGYYERK